MIHVRISQFRRIFGKSPGANGVMESDYTIHSRGLLQIIREHMAVFDPGTQFTPRDFTLEMSNCNFRTITINRG